MYTTYIPVHVVKTYTMYTVRVLMNNNDLHVHVHVAITI